MIGSTLPPRRWPWKVAASFFALPFRDLLRGEGRCVARPVDLLWLGLGLLAGWFVYVPVHELLHAAGCLAAGGSVSRLEIAPVYGGVFLAKIFPFVVAGGEYAGRLSGFDTRGSDLVYLATDLAPFVLTFLPGVWALRRAARSAPSWTPNRGLAFGAALPFAFAPLLSATGDAYEIGSILATRLPPWSVPAARELLRGDDLFLRLDALGALDPGAALGPARAWTGFALAATLGLLWAFATYAAGSWFAGRLGQRALEADGSGLPSP